MARHNPDRLLAQNPFRHFRRTYSLKEMRFGFAVLAVLVAISVWIGWRGTLRPPELYGAVELSGSSGGETGEAKASIIPSPLLSAEWTEGERSEFDTGNLYEKINGRADFFTSKGFERLYFLSVSNTEKSELTVDLELYDMGSPSGALAAFTAERKDGVDLVETARSQYYISRNALYMVKGRHYARAVGADESELILAALAEVREKLDSALEGTARSWALDFFVDGLGFETGKVTFVGERAFSLEAARAMWIAALDGDAEMFISAKESVDSAAAEAKAIIEGFSSYGSASETDPVLVTDEFLGAVSTAVAHKNFVLGVRAAADVDSAKAALARLTEAVDSMSAELLAKANAAAKSSKTDGSPEPGDDGSEEKPVDEAGAVDQTEPGLDGEETY